MMMSNSNNNEGVDGGGIRLPVDAQLARQDALRAFNPEIERPFASFEDACHRLLAFHVLADDDSDDVKDIVVDSTGRVLSYARYWNEALATKIKEHQSTFHTQLELFNSLSKKRTEGESRVEEDIMVEHLLLQDERRKMMDMKEEVENMRRAREEAKMKELVIAAEKVRTLEHQRQQTLLMQEQIRMPEPGGVCMRNGECLPIVGAMQDSSLSPNEAIQEFQARPPIVQGQHPYTSGLISTSATSTLMQGGPSYRAPSMSCFQMHAVENVLNPSESVSNSTSCGLLTPILQGQAYNTIGPTSTMQGSLYSAPVPSVQVHKMKNGSELQDSLTGLNSTYRGLHTPIPQAQHPYANVIPITSTSSITTTSMQGGPSFRAPHPSGLQMHNLVDNSFEMQEHGSRLNLNGAFPEAPHTGLPSFLQGKPYPFLTPTTVQGPRSSLGYHEGPTSSSLYREGPMSSSSHAPPTSCFQAQELGNGIERQGAQRLHPTSGSPDQEGIVEDLLDGWDEDTNYRSMNLLAPHSSSNDGGGLMLDLNSLTSTR